MSAMQRRAFSGLGLRSAAAGGRGEPAGTMRGRLRGGRGGPMGLSGRVNLAVRDRDVAGCRRNLADGQGRHTNLPLPVALARARSRWLRPAHLVQPGVLSPGRSRDGVSRYLPPLGTVLRAQGARDYPAAPRTPPPDRPSFAVVVPALNEEASIADLVAEVLAAANAPHLGADLGGIFVVDNGSTDRTAARALAAGATVVSEPRRGYGRACLSGVEAAAGADLVVLMDGDRSDQPAELPLILAPLLDGRADLVIGSRTLGTAEPGSLLPQQRAGNWVAVRLLRLLYGVRVTDIGPFRVIRRDQLLGFGMREMTYGWSVEMIARASRAGLRVREVPVSYRKRAGGESKVSGNLRASIRAGYRITGAILRCRWGSRPSS